MKYKVFFDREIPVDEEEIPEDFSFEMESRDGAFDYICDMTNDFPIMDVTEDGTSCYEEFNMFIENTICEANHFPAEV